MQSVLSKNLILTLKTIPEITANGYVKPILKTTVPEDTKSLMISNPNTPQHNWQSPEYTRDTSSVTR